jgi:hypothetical protein
MQEDFFKKPCLSTWRQLNQAYHEAVRGVWGWHPGRYAEVVEQLGKGLDGIAIVNLMQCPVPRDKYSNELIRTC